MSLECLDLTKIRPQPVAERHVRATEDDFAAPLAPGASVKDLIASLPNLGAAKDLLRLRDAVLEARAHARPVIAALGSHVLDVGLGPLFARMIEEGVLSAVALTGAALEQDVETALTGQILGPRDSRAVDGHFCATAETGELINHAARFAMTEGLGLGEAVGRALLDHEDVIAAYSITATAARFHRVLTVHPAIGADAYHLHPKADGAALGAAGMRDFAKLGGVLAEADRGVVLVFASGAVMPRVLLEALDAARNLGAAVEGLVTALVDPWAPSSAVRTLTERLPAPNGWGVWIPAPSELVAPLLFASVMEGMNGR
ncbi:MAG: hypothetical protein D6771_02560 [Zetaproteobacteria bacterium]|nr:MAG: hypothetical protein D6771_02560 [Zetaproteobacteria bacterium]